MGIRRADAHRAKTPEGSLRSRARSVKRAVSERSLDRAARGSELHFALGYRGGGWVAAQFLLMAAILALGLFPPSGRNGMRIAGLALLLAGLGFGIWAGRTLGTALTPYPLPSEKATLVEQGPYRYVRHPMYVAGLLIFLGYGCIASIPGDGGGAAPRRPLAFQSRCRGAPSLRAVPGTTIPQRPARCLGRPRVEPADDRSHERMPLRDDGTVAVGAHDRLDRARPRAR